MEPSKEQCGALSAEEYIKQRLDQYIGWYDNKAVKTKAKFLQMRAASVVGGAIVPVLINIHMAPTWDEALRALTTLISLSVVILVSLESVYHFGDQWKNYRSTEQYLNREKVLFLAAEGPYKGMDSIPEGQKRAYILLVERVEEAIASENASTLNVMVVTSQNHRTS